MRRMNQHDPDLQRMSLTAPAIHVVCLKLLRRGRQQPHQASEQNAAKEYQHLITKEEYQPRRFGKAPPLRGICGTTREPEDVPRTDGQGTRPMMQFADASARVIKLLGRATAPRRTPNGVLSN